MLMPPLKESRLQCEIELFFYCDDVSCVCPDEKKMVKNPNNSVAEAAPLSYRPSSLKALYQKFLAESSLSCSYETFTWNVPFYITRPKPDNWETCLCAMCLSPELKLEALAEHLKWNREYIQKWN